MNIAVLDAIHDYWFGDAADPPAPAERMQRWFRPTPEIDAYIRETFGPHLEAARSSDLPFQALTSAQQVALVVLLDQFPRQIYRDRAEAFSADPEALAIATRLVADGGWRRFTPQERTFVMLPFEHSESVADQDRGVLLFAKAVQAAPAEAVEDARAALDHATKHRDIIRRFGRFPHRNAALGRDSTPDEVEFLKGGRGF